VGRAIGNAQLRRARSCSCARARCALATIEPCAHRSVCRAAARRSRREVARSDRAPPCVFFCCLCYSLNPLNFTYSSWLLSFLLSPSPVFLSLLREEGVECWEGAWMDGWVGGCMRACVCSWVRAWLRALVPALAPFSSSALPRPFSFLLLPLPSSLPPSRSPSLTLPTLPLPPLPVLFQERKKCVYPHFLLHFPQDSRSAASTSHRRERVRGRDFMGNSVHNGGFSGAASSQTDTRPRPIDRT